MKSITYSPEYINAYSFIFCEYPHAFVSYKSEQYFKSSIFHAEIMLFPTIDIFFVVLQRTTAQ